MKQIVELDPELVAFRTVASLYTEEVFEHGIFRSSLGFHSGDNLRYLQAICEQDDLLGDYTKPSDSFKLAVGKLACIKKLPSLICNAGHKEIEMLVTEVFGRTQVPYEEELIKVFSDTPNHIEGYLIEQAKKQPARLMEVPELFISVLPEADEYFRLFTWAARSLFLSSKGREYLVGSNSNNGAGEIILSPFFEASTFNSVADWGDETQLISRFMENHGAFDTASYSQIRVDLTHIDNLSPETKVLTNDNTDQVERQFADLLVHLVKIRHAEPV
ncbi:MAG TPA: hypothetical protein PKD20_03950 [Candidatus Saccharibacteria bacterium]|jgi:hypothetical protein|nr:hypothetical protein [Candidatus Saccharibacteria bacterium]HMT56002.1 hypothetical protein [Candidatus Saccharibacteria bacterium]